MANFSKAIHEYLLINRNVMDLLKNTNYPGFGIIKIKQDLNDEYKVIHNEIFKRESNST